MQIDDSKLPALYRASDDVSNRAQKRFLKLIIADLSLIILGAFLSSIPSKFNLEGILSVLGVILLVVSFFITIWIRQGESEKMWYGGRALAESIKTLSWRYIMKAEPFQLTDKAAEKNFQDALSKLLLEKQALAVEFDEKFNVGDQVTEDMRLIRALPLNERKVIYINQRIKDQRVWYSKKSSFNGKREKFWFLSILSLQFISFVWASFLIKYPQPQSYIALISAGATALLMWLQVKKHRELAQSYAVAAQELGLVEIDGKHISSEDELSRFVGDAENAISREHTMWVARRDEPIS